MPSVSTPTFRTRDLSLAGFVIARGAQCLRTVRDGLHIYWEFSGSDDDLQNLRAQYLSDTPIGVRTFAEALLIARKLLHRAVDPRQTPRLPHSAAILDTPEGRRVLVELSKRPTPRTICGMMARSTAAEIAAVTGTSEEEVQRVFWYSRRTEQGGKR